MNKKVKGWLELVLGAGVAMKGVYDIYTADEEEIEEVPQALTSKSKYANMEEAVEVVEEDKKEGN
jgi:hypothetical protein